MRALFLLAPLLGLLAGCGEGSSNPAGAGPTKASELQDVGTMLQLYISQKGKPAGKPSDLTAHEGNFPAAYGSVKSGEILVNWGVKLPGEGDMATAPEEVVAYEKKTPAEGGFVLFLNGKVREVSSQQFKTSKMAK